jgi:hypothetical protein
MNLQKAVDQYLLERRAGEQAERLETYGENRDHFYFSELGKCKRKIAYEFFGLPKQTLAPRTLRILENGEYLQSRYSDYFKKMGIWVAEEVPYTTAELEDCPWAGSGRADIIINVGKLENPEYDKEKPDLEDLAIIEMKSINTWGFSKVVKENMPERDHYLQIQSYMWLSGIHKGWVVYEDKNDQTNAFIPVEYDKMAIFGSGDGRILGVVNEFTKLAEMIEKQEVPTRCPEAKAEGFPCKWKSGQCDFYDHCYDPEHHGNYIPKKARIVTIGNKDFDLDNLPEGYTEEMVMSLKALFEAVSAFSEPETVTIKDAVDSAIGESSIGESSIDSLMPQNQPKTPGVEFINDAGQKSVICPECGLITTYIKLGNGGTKQCDHCNTKIAVKRG